MMGTPHRKGAYDRPRIIELHEKGIPRCAIAARVGCSTYIVGKVIAQHKREAAAKVARPTPV